MVVALNARQQAFVREYLVDLVAAAAARRAGYSARTADRQGHDLLKVPEIAAAIEAAQKARAEAVQVRGEDVLRELVRVGLADPASAFSEVGELLPLREMPPEVRRAIAGVEVRTEPGTGSVVTRIKWWDKVRALDLLGRHLGLYLDRQEVSGPGGGPIKTTALAGASVTELLEVVRTALGVKR